MIFHLAIDADNAAFDPDPRFEIARLLRQLAGRLETMESFSERLHDINGNHTGTWRFASEVEIPK
jgi:hypothetical protein